MLIDPQLLALIVPLTALLLAVGLGLHLLADRETPGVAHWAVGYFLFAAGLSLISLRQWLPQLLSGAAGNALAAGGLLVVRQGLRRFLCRGPIGMHWWGLVAAAFAFNALFFDAPPPHLRIAANTAMVALVTLGLACEFLRSDLEARFRWVGGWVSLLIGLYLGVRVAHIISNPDFTRPFVGGIHGVWAYVAMIVWLTMNSFVMLMLAAARSQSRLRAALGEARAAGMDLEESNRELERFAYAVSHDLRAPLRMITSYMQLLERHSGKVLDADARSFIGFARDGARRLDSMVVSLLDYARAGRNPDPPRPVDARAALTRALAHLGPAADDAGADILVSGDWAAILGHDDEMVRLFQNLVGNALKYRDPERPVHVTVESAVTGGELEVRVRDNGIGIAPDQTEQLFQVFRRLHAGDGYEGSGIGLALCRRIVESCGGRIAVHSAGEGLGTTFIVHLPLAAASA